MPNPREFLKAFGLASNVSFSENSKILKVKIGHEVVQRYKRYAFPLTIQVVSTLADSTEVLEEFSKYVQGHRTAYSQYGNPYDCYIEDFRIRKVPSVDTNVRVYTVNATGYGDRVYL